MRSRISSVGLVIVVLLALSLTLSATAATNERPELVGRIGITAPNMHQDQLTADPREGIAFGLGAKFDLGAGFSLTPELWYQQKGCKDASLWEVVFFDLDVRTISIPLILSYTFPAKRVDSRAFAGLVLDRVLSAEIRENDSDHWIDVDDGTSSTYWSVVVGGGVKRGRFDLDVRYQHGISAMADFDTEYFSDVSAHGSRFQDAWDRTWIFSLGAWF